MNDKNKKKMNYQKYLFYSNIFFSIILCLIKKEILIELFVPTVTLYVIYKIIFYTKKLLSRKTNILNEFDMKAMFFTRKQALNFLNIIQLIFLILILIRGYSTFFGIGSEAKEIIPLIFSATIIILILYLATETLILIMLSFFIPEIYEYKFSKRIILELISFFIIYQLMKILGDTELS